MSITLAFCGTGLMGAPMVRRLLAAGHRVRVWNRSAAKAQALAADGAEWAATPAEAAHGCDGVFLCLTDEDAVHDTVFGAQGVHHAGGAWLVDHSSIAPDAARRYAAQLQQTNGRVWVDAPVSGGVAGAQAGTLSIMAGGPAETIDTASLYMRAYAGRITRMGAVGAGQVAKLCNQTIVASTVNAVAEAVALAQRSGIDAAALNTALAGGWADSPLLQIFVPRMTGPIERPLGSVATMLKDVENVAALARASNTELAGLNGVLASYRAAAAQGLGSADLSDIVRVAWPERPASHEKPR